MMSYFRLTLVLLSVTVTVQAGYLEFSADDLLILSRKWQQGHADIYSQPITGLKNIQEIKMDDQSVASIVFPVEGGYLVFSNRDEIRPLLAVSPSFRKSRLESTHPLLRLLKLDLSNRMARVALNPNEALKHTLEWEELFSSTAPAVSRLDTIYFNETPSWGQGWTAGAMVFNLYTPNHWSTGCVATALAEILTYYHWPPRGTGSNSYWDNGVNLSVNYNDYTYDWENTLDDYTNTFSNQTQKQAAGLLSYHTAVSVNMDFEAAGSTANTADGATALHYHFRSSGHYTSSSASGFMSQVIANLEDGRPVVLALNSAVDHAAVADGYASQYGLVHMNYGWDGDSNGWYDITSAFLPGYNYTIIGALKGIVPNPMISDDIQWLDENSFVLSWLTSFRMNAQYFELQQKLGSGNWTTLSASIEDTSRVINVSSPGTYKYRVRAYRDNIWWDWSREFTVSIGNDVSVEFVIDMQDRPLSAGEEVVLLGNINPLGNVQNSPDFTYQGQGIYTTDVTFENSYVGDTLLYRFGVSGDANPDIEVFNRAYPLTAGAYQSLDTARFNIQTSVDEAGVMVYPESFSVQAVYPNPFNSTVNIRLEAVQSGILNFQIYDLGGRARGIVLPYSVTTGMQTIQIDFNPDQFASGVYFIRMEQGGYSTIKKCQLLK